MSDVLLGRDNELAAFERVLAGISAGRGRLLVVEGEPGLGKTRLCEAFAAAADGRADLAWVTCWEADAVPALWPVRRLLSALGEAAPEPSEVGDPQAARVALFDAVADVLAKRDHPLVLVIDDLQWADDLSLAFLRFVAPMLRTMRVAVVVAARTGEGDPQLLRHGDRLRLTGLAAPDLSRLVAEVVGSTPTDDLVRRLLQTTGGNPLFVRELAAAGDDAPVPATVRDVLGRRFDGLSPQCRSLLEVVALVDDEPGLDVLSAVVEEADIVALLDEAAGADVIVWVGESRVRFAHPLLRALVVDSLAVANRLRLHQRIALVLEAMLDAGRHVELASLAAHFAAAAGAGSAEAAVRYAVAAGDEAVAQLAYEQAVRHYERALAALDLAPGAADRLDLLLKRGDALVAAGRPDDARAVFRDVAVAARSAGNAAALAAAALGTGSGGGFEVALFDDEQQRLLQQAIDVVQDPPLRARLVARLSVAQSLDQPPAQRRTSAEEAVALARASGDPAAVCDALAALSDALASTDDTERRIAWADEIVAVARAADDPARELLGHRLLVVARFEQGDIPAVRQQVDSYARTARRLRQPLYDWYVPLWQAAVHWVSGETDRGLTALTESEAIGREAGSPNSELLAMTASWFASMDFGAVDQSLMDQIPVELALMTWVLLARAQGFAVTGDLDASRALLDAAAADLPNLHRDSEWLPALVQAADAAARTGHGLAVWLYDTLLPQRHRFAIEGIGAYCHGSVERYLGELAASLGRAGDARRHFAAARMADAAGGAGLAALTEAAERLFLATPAQESGTGRFRRTGEVWEVGLSGRVGHVKDGKGMRDVALLIASPRHAVAAVDLLAGGKAPFQGDTGEVVDAQARAAYRDRLRDLEVEIDDATVAADLARAEKATEERDRLVEHLTSAYGIGGRPRRSGDPRERARTTVTARIRDAVKRVTAVDAELGEHLRRSVQTGTFCSYDPAVDIHWDL